LKIKVVHRYLIFLGGIQIQIQSGNRYGTGSGSGPRATDPVATAPGTVPEVTFTYA